MRKDRDDDMNPRVYVDPFENPHEEVDERDQLEADEEWDRLEEEYEAWRDAIEDPDLMILDLGWEELQRDLRRIRGEDDE